MFLTTPKKILVDSQGHIKAIECLKMKLGEPDASGRPRPVVIEGSEFLIEVDTVIIAIGQSPNPLLPHSVPGLKVSRRGTIEIDDHYQTSLKGVFAGGDIVTGADTVISAMGAGKRTAREIDKYLSHQ